MRPWKTKSLMMTRVGWGVGEVHRIESGGYGSAECKISIVQKIKHDGEVNRQVDVVMNTDSLEPAICLRIPILLLQKQ